MTTTAVLVVGGPLDGNVYSLHVTPGETIQLNSAAGVCTYRFDDHEPLAHYVDRAQHSNPGH